MKLQEGFTLVELMVVVAIIAILASVAMPAYNDYVTRGKIPDATSTLATKRVQMEQYFQDNRKYDGGPAACNADTTTSNNFDFSCATGEPTATTYIIQAVGKNSMAGFTYTIDQSNNRQTTSAPTAWQAGSMPTSCWITKKGGAC